MAGDPEAPRYVSRAAALPEFPHMRFERMRGRGCCNRSRRTAASDWIRSRNRRRELLTLKGEFKEEKEVKKVDYYRQERWCGTFARSIEIPTSVDTEEANATFESGILTLTLPKKEEVRAKTIKVQTRTS